jgi:hypothetical protein
LFLSSLVHGIDVSILQRFQQQNATERNTADFIWQDMPIMADKRMFSLPAVDLSHRESQSKQITFGQF